MNQMYPETERSEAAERGTAAHELAARMVEAGACGGAGMPSRSETVETAATNGIIFDNELFDSAAEYASYVIKLMQDRRIFGGDCLGVEARVEAEVIHKDSFGTVDFYLYDKATNELFIVDLKNGYGLVEVSENWQLVNYAYGVLDTLGLLTLPAETLDAMRLNLVIIQPNGFHRNGTIRQWCTTLKSVEWMFMELVEGARRALAANPETRSGPHCRYCRARHSCPAALEAGPHLYESVADVSPLSLTTPQMARMYTYVTRSLSHMRSLAIAFEEQLKAAAVAGEIIPGYRMETTTGREVWTKPYSEIAKLGDLLGRELRKDELITPTQARKLGVDDSLMSLYANRPTAGVKLIPENTDQARKVFKS